MCRQLRVDKDELHINPATCLPPTTIITSPPGPRWGFKTRNFFNNVLSLEEEEKKERDTPLTPCFVVHNERRRPRDLSPFIKAQDFKSFISEVKQHRQQGRLVFARHSVLHPDKWGSWQENNEGWCERASRRKRERGVVQVMKREGRQKVWKRG